MNKTQKKIKIGWIEAGRGDYGGHAYNRMAREALQTFCDLEEIRVENKVMEPPLAAAEILARLSFVSGEKDFWILEIPALMVLHRMKIKGRKIALIHHEDFSGYPAYKKFILQKLWKKGFENLKNCDAIITVSKFWQEHYLKQGFKNVHLIYNAFKLEEYNTDEEELAKFAKENKLEGKTVVYIGNCHEAKGVIETYEALKDMNLHLVSSGKKKAITGAQNFDCDFRSYLNLLKIAKIAITMSKFDEGWCRTAQEAMLLGTPVIGSGRGGMRELLEGGGQVICEDFGMLKEKVQNLLQTERENIIKSGYEFASKFTYERFLHSWKDFFINKI